jgi:protein ImuB
VTHDCSGSRRYLALWFPFLSAERLRIARRQLPDAPFALVEKQRGALRLAAVDPRALALGLGAGMALADARALVPDLGTFEHDPAADRAWLDRLARGCARYTPMVAPDPPAGLVLDVTGAAHLFGGETGLAGDAAMRLARLGMTLRQAFAGTPDAARALARHRGAPVANEAEAIRLLPVAALELDPEATLGLTRAGLQRIGDLARRPQAAVAARFDEAAVTALRRLLGEAQRPIDPRLEPPRIMAERRFPEPIARVEYALAVLGELTAEAAGQLEQRGCGGRRFEAVLFRSDGLTRELAVDTGTPTRDSARLGRLFGERIEGLSDPLDPGFGFDMIRLTVPRIEPLGPVQTGLEDGPPREGVAELADRLAVRLGRDRVRLLRPADTHIPERAQRLQPAADPPPTFAWPAPEAGEPPLRPLFLFDPPQPVEVIAEVPDGPPRQFRWRRILHDVRRFEGPERIAAEWWRHETGHRPGENGLTRDYYRIEDARGRRYWLFRHGLYGEKPDPRWYVHGLFA